MADLPAERPPVQANWIVVAIVCIGALATTAFNIGLGNAALLIVGVGMGVTLYHSDFGFSGSFRALFSQRDLSGVGAQFIMISAAMILFAPVLAEGKAFGHTAVGAVAPVGVSMMFGAFLFGIGMQLGGGCASGTLFTAGGGNVRMWVVLIFFCAGGFWASLHMPYWWALPSFGAVSFGNLFGYPAAVAGQIAVLASLYGIACRIGARPVRDILQRHSWSWCSLLRGPWPLIWGAVALALLNWITLMIAGHPWSITWGFTLWAAKTAQALGWDPESHLFWQGGFQAGALAQPILADVTSLLDIGLILGALLASSLSGTVRPTFRIAAAPLMAAVIGGLMMGYGARLAYGCNIGAFFSGTASTSLHGWAWFAAALAGTWIGMRLRPLFLLDA